MRNKKVLVGMSGGIDSSVAAYLLKKAGYEVIGLTLQLWPGYLKGSKAFEAKKTAAKLGIDHYVLDVEEAFRKEIIEKFCREYWQGKTPNPCIRCNQYIKFRYLFKKAGELGIKFVATGHYARVEYNKRKKCYLLKKGVDSKKDQSYVLYFLRQNQLARILLPLGNYSKKKATKGARALGFPAEQRESQDICFIPGNNYRSFLKDWFSKETFPGPILNGKGEMLGKHSGIAFYTIGQRRGLGISSGERRYVTRIEAKTNSIFIGSEKNLYQREVIAQKVHYIYRKKTRGFSARAKIRYLHKEREAQVTPQKRNTALVRFKKPQRAITPGQAVVFYDGKVVLGGGIIKKSLK